MDVNFAKRTTNCLTVWITTPQYSQVHVTNISNACMGFVLTIHLLFTDYIGCVLHVGDVRAAGNATQMKVVWRDVMLRNLE